ncbi:sugar ABC transporter ATP-binding protein [Thermoanaerobacterium sp. RBIITD]|uniref:sugar ABC transporter ATP-binding protein n=1 Tax=Thermoanaerobacterium sp. RBIITD TaxID=1550240 RepID=UPI000BB68157|nr:sugar ABC transporter ATP-binding protein [Thermoanaerobacterium sp. RBIITD]SNX53368.1 L-arabinose transport system ATP-binding protein [Thermoanaerobacterium sp. RBIITD]
MNNTLEFKNITKYFPGVKALDNISFTAYGGEVLALLGENGAGKSTLLKILNGDYQPTYGQYLLNGEVKHFSTPNEAIEAGISVIYQERQVLKELSVAENIFLGHLPIKSNKLIDVKKLYDDTQKVIDEFGLPINPRSKVKNISVAHQQMVEIMKSYIRESKVIAFDEPTASLSDNEIEILFKTIRKLKKEGKVILYVSHRMEELKEIADKIAIFKDGRLVKVVDNGELTERELIKLMVGRDLGDIFNELDRNKDIGETLLEVKNISSDYIRNISFSLRKGEILGFSGLVGAGRTEVMRAIVGADRLRGGEIYLDGKKIVNHSPNDALENGIVLVPEDRKTQGIIPNLSVGRNITISIMKEICNKFGFISNAKETKIAEDNILNFKIKTPDQDKKIVELSGGNQQKAIVARGLVTNPKVLILDEPTKGIDVGAKSELYHLICELSKRGMGIIVISSELPEVIGLCDRIIVMKSGKITGEVLRKDASEERVLSFAMLEESGDLYEEKI